MIGGLAGKFIEEKNHKGSSNAENASVVASPSACPSVVPSSGVNGTATSNATAGLALPFLDCERDDRKILTSNFSKIDFKLYCDVDWTGGDGDSSKTLCKIIATLLTLSQFASSRQRHRIALNPAQPWNRSRTRTTELDV